MLLRLLVLSLATSTALVACKSTEPESPEPVAATADPSPAAADEAPEVTCASVRGALTQASPSVGDPIDVEALSGQLRTADASAMPGLIEQVEAAGMNARGVVPSLRGRLGNGDLAISAAIYGALPHISIEDAVSVAEEGVANGNTTLAERMLAANTLGALGEPGAVSLTEIVAADEVPISAEIMEAALDGLSPFPIAARDVVFAVNGVCGDTRSTPECADARRMAGLVFPTLLDGSVIEQRILRTEREALLAGRRGPHWEEAYVNGLYSAPAYSEETLRRVHELGYPYGMERWAFRAVIAPQLTPVARREQTLWLLSTGPLVDTLIEAIGDALAERQGEPVAGLLGTLAVAAGRDGLSESTVDAMVELAHSSRTGIGVAAHLAAARVTSVSRLDDIPAESLPAGFAEVRALVAGDDVQALATRLVDESVPLGLALTAASIGAGGRRAAFSEALFTLPPSARALEVAAAGADVHMELARGLAEFVMDTDLSIPVAMWIGYHGHVDKIIGAAQSEISSAFAARRRRAVQWANLAEIQLEQDDLLEAIVAPPRMNELEPASARLLPLLAALRNRPPSLEDAWALRERVPAGKPGHTEASLLLAASYAAHCETQ